MKMPSRLILMPLFVAVGCGPLAGEKGAEPADGSSVFSIDDPVEPIVLRDAVRVIDERDAQVFSGFTTSFPAPPTEVDASALDNARFLVGPTQDGEGFLSKVVSVRTVDGRQIADLEPATLDEVIESGDWKHEIPGASDEEVEAAPFFSEDDLAVDASVNPQGINLLGTSRPIFKLNLAGKRLSAPSTVAGDFSVVIDEGYVSYSPTVTIGGQHRLGKITQFSFISAGTMNVRMKISANLTKGISKGGDNALFPPVKYPFAFAIGAVPVAGTIQLDVIGAIRFDSSVTGRLETVVDCSFPIQAGGQYNRGQWTKTAAPQVTCSASPVTGSVAGAATAKVIVSPELSVRLYGVVGPNIDLEPYVKATTAFKSSPRLCTYQVGSGISSTFSVSAKLFKWEVVPYKVQLFERHNTLASGTYCH